MYIGAEQEIPRLWLKQWLRESKQQVRRQNFWKLEMLLEEAEMEPFIEEIESLVSGKTILLFGSYGWGDGEWMRDWAERMKNAGAVLLREEGIITNDAPEDDMLEELKAAGQELAQKA